MFLQQKEQRVTQGQHSLPDLHPIRAVYPFDQHWFEVGGATMHYLDEGAGPAVLMLHGNPTWSFYYRRLVQALRPTHRVIVPDHIGCGLSAKPQRYPYTLDTHIENVARLMSHLDIREADLVVHDWGGAIGMGYALRHGLKVRRIVVLNTAAFLSPLIPFRIAVCKVPGFGDLAIRGLNGFAGAATTMAVEQPMDEQTKRGFLLPYDSWHNRIATLRFVQDIPMRPTHPTWDTVAWIGKHLEQLRDVPMQIHWGGRDWCFNDYFLAEWMRRFPDATVFRYDQAGHYVLEDAASEIVPRVETFLRSN